jgi:hypothetical protein
VKDAAKLESQMYNLPPDKRGDHANEIKKLIGTTSNKKGDK